jgi:large subunit ribosomal protein L31
MKEGIHPNWYPEAKIYCNGELIGTVGATQPEINVEIWSGTHPFYTGKQRLVDTEGQVDRFLRRLRKREEIQLELDEKEEQRDPTAWTTDSMDLGTRAVNALQEAGFTTVGDVLSAYNEGEDTLLAIQGVGQKALIDIKRFLRAEGLIE